MNTHTYSSIESLITFQPGMKEEMVAASDSALYHLLLAFRKAAREYGEPEMVERADEYMDRLIARI